MAEPSGPPYTSFTGFTYRDAGAANEGDRTPAPKAKRKERKTTPKRKQRPPTK